MVINVIVVSVTVLMSGFVIVWLVCPRCRSWIEAPKWQPLSWDEEAVRPETSSAPGASQRSISKQPESVGGVFEP